VVPAVVACFCSRQDRLFVASAKCLAMLRGHFAARPEVVGSHGKMIARTVLKTFETMAGAPALSAHLKRKAKLRGLLGVGAEAMLATSTRLLSALLNNRQSAEWFKTLGEEKVAQPAMLKEAEEIDVMATKKQKGDLDLRQFDIKKKGPATALEKSTFFDALVLHIRNALEQPSMQPSALQLLRRVLLRNRVLSAAVYDCVDAVGEVMIAGSDKRTAQQCAQIFVDFMLDYPHEQKALQHRITHLLRNLGYAEEGGRRAVLNCLYLVVLHFPEAELSSKWGGLIFVSAAARLPQEPDPTAHRMLHVLIRTLLGRLNPSSRDRLLELVLQWGQSPKRALHAALAECLGLFSEAVASGNSTASTQQLLEPALPALARVLRLYEESLSSDSAPSTGTPPWRLAYAVCKGFERMLVSSPPALMAELMSSRVTKSLEAAAPAAAESAASEQRTAGKGKGGGGKKHGADRDGKKAAVAARDSAPEAAPGAIAPTAMSTGSALQLLWRNLLGGPGAFVDESRHTWVVSCSLRVLQSQSEQWLANPGLAAKWLSGSDAGAQSDQVTAYGLLGALEALMSSERVEVEPSIAPLGVKALRSFLRVLLQSPELVPESAGGKQDGEQDEEDETKEAPIGGEKDDEADRSKEDEEAEVDKEEEGKQTEEQKEDSPGDKVEGVEADEGMPPAEEEGEPVKGPLDEDEDEDEMGEAAAAGLAAEDELLEDSRHIGPSLFEEATGEAPRPVASAAAAACSSEMTPSQLLRRSRVRWLIVRLSHRARAYLSDPNRHFVRLVSIFRLFHSLLEFLSVDILSELMAPLLSPSYRCSTAFTARWNDSRLQDVQTLEQALNLGSAQRCEFLAQLAQTLIDGISQKMQEAGRMSEFNRALASMRKAVERHRADRVLKKRLKPVVDPTAAAAEKRSKNRRKVAGKKRKLEEMIQRTKGGRGKQKVIQSRSLV